MKTTTPEQWIKENKQTKSKEKIRRTNYTIKDFAFILGIKGNLIKIFNFLSSLS